MKITGFLLGLLLALTVQAAPKTSSHGEIGWRMVKVHHGRFQVPHLIRYRDPKTVKSVNRQIDALDALEESTYTFNFSPRGLEVQPDWPHVIQACEIRVTVPYAKLKPYAAPGKLLERMLG